MKYCPYCGAAVLGNDVVYCAECGKTLSENKQSASPALPPKKPPRYVQQHSPAARNTKRPPAKHIPPKRKAPLHSKAAQSKPLRPPVRDPDGARRKKDDGYDGYYDDVATEDNGHSREGLEPELIKRIAIVAAVTVLIIILSVVLMSVL